MRRGAVLALAMALLAASPAPAYELVARGKAGRSAAELGTCKYGVFGPRGVLSVGITGPAVTGANTRRGTRREITHVRYLVDVTNVAGGHATLLRSGWSGWTAVRQSQKVLLAGSSFDMDWQGQYGADVLIEWWNSRRRVGYRWHRLERFFYVDHYNRGPWGPFSDCARWNFPFN